MKLKDGFLKILDKLSENFSILLLFVLLFLSFFLLDTFWVDILNKIWVNPIMSKMNRYESIWVPILVLFIIIYYVNAFRYEKIVNKKRIILLSVFTAIYLICFFSGNWTYYHSSNCLLLSYANISLIPIIVECCLVLKIKIKRLLQNNQENNPELEAEGIDNESDSYQRQPMIATIAKIIEQNFHKTQSFATGISGMWGSGKTTFLRGLKKELSDNDKNEKIAVLLFEPWKSDSPDSIVKNFFDLYRGEISKYAPKLSPVIKEYVLQLLNEENSGIIKVCTQISESLIKNGENKDLYEDISESLKKIVHKTVVFIDDIDRLNTSEIIEVLRLIRNTANFPYLQFVVTYDKEYLVKILDSSGVPKPEQYLEKIFNLEIPLPKFEERIICYELHLRIMKTLNSLFSVDKDNTIYKDMIFHRCSEESPVSSDYLIPKILKNNRDVIRFHNSFKLILRCFQDSHKEIDYRDLFYLELLRYRFSKIYDILRNNPLLLLNMQDEFYSLNTIWTSSQEEQDAHIQSDLLAGYTISEREIIKELVELLFDSRAGGNRIAYTRSYDKYFMFRLDKKILSQTELLALAEENDTELLSKAEGYYKNENKYLSEFENQLSNTLASIRLEEYIDKETNVLKKRFTLDFSKPYRIIRILSQSRYRGLRNEVTNATLPHIQSLNIYGVKQLQMLLDLLNYTDLTSFQVKKFDLDNFLLSILYKNNLSTKLKQKIDDEVISVVKSFLQNCKWSNLFSPAISSFIERHNSEKIADTDLVLEMQELKEIQLTYFLQKENKLDNSGFTLLYNCIDHIDLHPYKVHLRREALDCMKEAIEKTPEAYLEKFIEISDKRNTVSIEESCEQIFGNWEEFERFLNMQSDSPVTIRVKNFWELYKYNNFSPLGFGRKVNIHKKFQENFVNEIKKLEELKEIDKELSKNRNSPIEELKKRFENNNLQIAYREEVSKRISSWSYFY